MINNLHSRRNFLKGTVLATGGLVLSVQLPRLGRAAIAAGQENQKSFFPNAFIKIDNDGITLIMAHHEVGQGIFTSSAMLMAEELEVGLDQVKLQPAPQTSRNISIRFSSTSRQVVRRRREPTGCA